MRLFHIVLITSALLFTLCSQPSETPPDNAAIDRKAVITRHNPALDKVDVLSPFSIGNGNFAFTADVTGLQTLAPEYEAGIPLCTQSNWGWHTSPAADSVSLKETYVNYKTGKRQIAYASNQHTKAAKWLRANPHRLHLGRLSLCVDGSPVQTEDISAVNQELNCWTGILHSRFRCQTAFFNVKTACHPQRDAIGLNISSDLLDQGAVSISLEFPAPSQAWGKNAADWQNTHGHQTDLLEISEQQALIRRSMDETVYYVLIQWQGQGIVKQTGPHTVQLQIKEGRKFQCSTQFMQQKYRQPLPSADSIMTASAGFWKSFWNEGAAIDLTACRDKRAFELERRIVLSRYLTALQCAGSLPPQETGLTCNSWHGKFHLEMHWWHAVHFALWNQPKFLENSMNWYLNTALPAARQTAAQQGYQGARWPKMVGPDGRESPSNIGVFLLWQQVHPIYYAELLYKQNPLQETVQQYAPLVFESAAFMASFLSWNSDQKQYQLGPPMIPAQEIYTPKETFNPPFELAYWRLGLEIAQKWRQRLGRERSPQWEHILQHLSPLPVNKGVYQNAGHVSNTFDDPAHCKDHPTLLAPFGMLGSSAADLNTMRRTLRKVMKSWDLQSTWGWDYPLMAMTAARTGMPDLAIDALLMDTDKNRCLNNGHYYQSARLPVYLPANGALLSAVAMMAGGWSGTPDSLQAPGFPKDGKWTVKAEGFWPML